MQEFKLISTPPVRWCEVKGTLSHIPVEVYLEIFEHMKPSRNEFENDVKDAGIDHNKNYRILLRNLAQVCRQFCYLALTGLIHSIEIEPEIYNFLYDAASADRTLLGLCSGYTAFCRNVREGKEPSTSLVHLIHEVKFTDWDLAIRVNDHTQYISKEAVEGVNPYLKKFTETLPKMPNLRSLVFCKSHIEQFVFQEIIKCKKLKYLTFDRCTFSTDIPEEVFSQLFSELPSLSSFDHLWWPNYCITWPAIRHFPTRAEEQEYNPFQNIEWSQRLEHWSPVTLSLVQTNALASYPKNMPFLENLTSLSIRFLQETQIPDFALALSHALNINTLSVDAVHTEEEPSPEIYAHLGHPTLPRLHTIHCPPPMGQHLIPNKRLREISLIGSNIDKATEVWVLDQIPGFDTTTCVLESLRLVLGSPVKLSIPGLVMMTLCDPDNIGLVEEKLSTLERLEIESTVGGCYERVRPGELIEAMKLLSFPNLKTFVLNGDAKEGGLDLRRLSKQEKALCTLKASCAPGLINAEMMGRIRWIFREKAPGKGKGKATEFDDAEENEKPVTRWKGYVPPEYGDRVEGLLYLKKDNGWEDYDKIMGKHFSKAWYSERGSTKWTIY